MTKPLFATFGALALMAAAGAAQAQPDGGYGSGYGRGPDGGRRYDLAGPGVQVLIPELRDTARGRAFVMRDFDFDHDGLVEVGEARAANRAFRDSAGGDRGRFDHDRFDRDRGGYDDAAGPPPPPPPPAMRAYHFRQNRYGAVFSIGDVLFETGSARLRATARDTLRPLADYLRANPRQRLRIDGYTDAVGTAQSNLILSRDRARSVADALSAAGVDATRFQLEGHGEDSPVSSNATAAGRQLNRRVEVTLIGRRAADFG